MTIAKQVGLILVALMAATSAGCKTKPKNITPIPGGNASVAGAGGLIGRDTSGSLGSDGGVVTIDESGNIGLSGLEEFEDMLMDREALAAQTVYFHGNQKCRPPKTCKQENTTGGPGNCPEMVARHFPTT